MQENNFEEQVRQKMEDLNLVPSPPVWPNIEERIRKKRDRRRIVLWLLPLLLLSGLIWWAFPFDQKTEKLSSNSLETTHQKNKINQEPEPSSHTSIEKNSTVADKLTNNRKKIQKNGFTVLHKEAKNSNITTTFEQLPSTATHKRKIERAALGNTFVTLFKNKDDTTKVVTSKTELTKERTTAQDSGSVIILSQVQKEKSLFEHKDSSLKKEDSVERKAASVNKVVQAPGQKKSNNWKLGITAGVGFSSIGNGLFSFSQNKAYDALLRSNPNSSSNLSSQFGPTGTTILAPSKIKRGFSYFLGINLSKSISKKSSISLGLGYHYLSTTIKVGTQRDSVSNTNLVDYSSRYYSNNNRQTAYTNQYHFIKLPFLYEYQLGRKLPLKFGTGISIGYLLSSNALQYDNTSNIFYKDNSLLQKPRIELVAKAAYGLWRHPKFSANIGPQWNYGLTPLSKESNSTRQHLSSFGLSTQVTF